MHTKKVITFFLSLVLVSSVVSMLSVNAAEPFPDIVVSDSTLKYSEELLQEIAKADENEKIRVRISFADVDPAVVDAEIHEKFSGKYGTLDEYSDYEKIIVPRIITEAEDEFGEILAHAHVYRDDETGEIIAKGFDAYVRSDSELQKMMESMSFEARMTYVHSGFSEEELKKALEICVKGYSVITSRMSNDIDDYRMVIVNTEIELNKKNVSACLSKYISEDEIISNAMNTGVAMLTKDQIEEISRDSQVDMIDYAPLIPVHPSVDDGETVTAIPDTVGDINSDGKTDVTDLSVLSLYLIGDTEFTDVQKKSADVDGDGEVKLADLAKYRQYLSKVIPSLEVKTDISSNDDSEGLKWNGKEVSSELGVLLDNYSDSGLLISVVPVIDIDKNYTYNGKTLSEYSSDMYDRIDRFRKMQELTKDGDALKYGELLYTTGTDETGKWAKELYDSRVEYYGEELIKEYCSDGKFLKEKLLSDIEKIKNEVSGPDPVYEEALNDYYSRTYTGVIKELEEQKILYNYSAPDNLIIKVTTEEFRDLKLSNISRYKIPLLSEDD